jgi:iron complex outermembrane receptor protein
MDWELGAQYSQAKVDSVSPGLGLASSIQSRIDGGAIDVFAVNTDTGNFGDGLESGFLTNTQAAAATSVTNDETRIVSTDFTVNFDAFQMNNGPVPVALGVEYRDEKFSTNTDEQGNAGNFQGSSGGSDATGARTVKAIFGETTVPILSMLDLNVAGRWEDYNDFGTTFNPKVSASFRPLDSLLLRGSWGQGFRAPSMTQLYSSTSQSFDGAIDNVRCAAAPNGNPDTGRDQDDPTGANVTPGNPCRLTQYQNFRGGNRDLGAEESTSWNVGLVWNPLDDLSIALDWFDIELEDEIGLASMQGLLDQEFRLRNEGATPEPYRSSAGGGVSGERVGAVVRDPGSQQILTVLRPNSNFAKRETDGLDIESSYAFGFGAIGDFRATAQWTYVNEYERDEDDGEGLRDPQFLDPEHRGTIGLNWALGDFGANILFNYIGDASIQDADGITTTEIDDYQTWDMSATYATPWNGTVTIGARNIFDEDPPTSVALSSPYYSNQLHDVYGRVPYIRYEQDL